MAVATTIAAAQAGVHPSLGQVTPPSPKQLKQLTLEELGNLEVTTYNKAPSEVWDTPAAIYVITSEDILRSGATSIADALRLAPGVEVGRLSSTTWAVGIRGLQNNFSKSVLVLIDGRNVYTPLFAGVYWDVQDLPLENIDRIEVIRGPGGTIWGPNAGNGVINIITKHAAETHGVIAHALIGTEDHTIDDLEIGAKTGGVDFRVFGRGFERAHEYHTDGINEDEWHQERLGFRADWAAGRDSYFLTGALYQGNSPHIIGALPIYDHTAGGDINLRWERKVNDHSNFYVQGYFDRTLRTQTTFGETRNTIDLDFIHHLDLGSAQHFSYGVGLRWSPFAVIPEFPEETLIPAATLDHVYTGFVQDEVRLAPKLWVTGGAKLQHNNYSGWDVQPSGRMLYALSEHQTLWAGVTRAVTTPSDIEENFFLEGPAGPNAYIELVGDRDFKSEDLVGYEAGYRGMLNRHFYFDLSAFWNRYTNLQSFTAPTLEVENGSTFIIVRYANQISGSTAGFEVAPQLDVTSWWRVNASYSYLNANFSADGPTSDVSSTGSVSTYEKSTPKHMVNVESKMDLPWQFHFDQMYRYASVLPAQNVPAYQTMDLHLARAIGRHFTLEAVGQNLFQPHHLEWGTGDPTQPPVGIERAGYLELSFRSKTLPH